MSKKKRYPPRFPRYANGIRLQSPRSAKDFSWWAKRWNDSVSCKDIGGRYGRGRAYAAGGQVASLEISAGKVDSIVTGLRPEPYAVTILFRQPEGESRRRIVESIKRSPAAVARLVSGDMPLELEEIFRREKLDFFPGGKLSEDKYDVTTRCTCPDWANPCKHSFAVLELLGEEIASRPWRLLELRGIRIGEVMP